MTKQKHKIVNQLIKKHTSISERMLKSGNIEGANYHEGYASGLLEAISIQEK